MIYGKRHLTRDDVGTVEEKSFFAFFPVQLTDGRKCWLERVVARRTCKQCPMYQTLSWSAWEYTPLSLRVVQRLQGEEEEEGNPQIVWNTVTGRFTSNHNRP